MVPDPFGAMLEKMGACAKPFQKLLKIYGFYLDPHFSAWDRKGLGPDPPGVILGKMGACAKPFQKLLEIYGLYLDPHFSAWGQKGLEPDPQFSLWAHVGFMRVFIGCPILTSANSIGFIWTIIFSLGPKGFGT